MLIPRIIKLLKQPVSVGLIVFISLMALTQFLSYQRYLLLKDANLRELSAQADLTKEKLQTVMTNNFSATQTLAFITEKNGVPQDFDGVGKKLLQLNKYVSS